MWLPHGAGPLTRKSPSGLGLAVGALLLALPAGAPARGAGLGPVEAAYQDARRHKDQVDVTRARGAMASLHSVPLDELLAHYNEARSRLKDALAAVPGAGLSAEDGRALEVIRRTFEKDLGEEKDAPA